MPPALVAALPIILAGAGTGITAYEAFKGPPKAPTDPNAAAEAAQQKTAAATSEKEAIARQQPDLQAQLGGAVAPEYYADLAAKEAGFAGDTNPAREALSSLFSSGGGPSFSPATPQSGGKGFFDSLTENTGDSEKGASGGFTGV